MYKSRLQGFLLFVQQKIQADFNNREFIGYAAKISQGLVAFRKFAPAWSMPPSYCFCCENSAPWDI